MNCLTLGHLFLWLLTASVASANTFLASSSFPGDTRQPVTEMGEPWRCIGRLSLPDHRFMTASLVGPDLILTAAHGLVRDGRLKPGRFIFQPGYGGSSEHGSGSALVTHCWLGSYRPDQEAQVHADWALLQIDRNLGAVDGVLGIDQIEAATLAANRRPLTLVSYDRDFQHGQIASWETGGGFVALNPSGCLLHDFSTDNGASGAPIFYFTNWSLTASARIVALNVAEKTAHGATLYRVPFSLRIANVAVPSEEFYPTLRRLLAGDLSDGEAVPIR